MYVIKLNVDFYCLYFSQVLGLMCLKLQAANDELESNWHRIALYQGVKTTNCRDSTKLYRVSKWQIRDSTIL
jgi:hypothetical protein